MFPRPVRLDPARLDPARLDSSVRGAPREPSGGRASSGVPARFRYQSRIHRVLCVQGPERIETAWWRGPSVRRDYFVVEAVAEEGMSGDSRQEEEGDRTGSVEGILRLWIFRQVRDGGWFVHGIFA